MPHRVECHIPSTAPDALLGIFLDDDDAHHIEVPRAHEHSALAIDVVLQHILGVDFTSKKR